ncbi:FG-GAP repeat domain-containing protein [Streptomyces sp. RB17]|uniref:FG-GAP repeat domain-containing protein n=1 Tax=Streptomyces sp. RB17 TaxID=2585197 RepID=UPI0012953BB1
MGLPALTRTTLPVSHGSAAVTGSPYDREPSGVLLAFTRPLGAAPGPHRPRARGPTAYASKTVAPVRDDFNGDGYPDLAVAAPNGTIDGRSAAGCVTVMHGGPHGLSTGRRTILSRATGAIPGSPAAGQRFGLQLSKGDLDGDGYADLVVGTGSASADAVVVWGRPARPVRRRADRRHRHPDRRLRRRRAPRPRRVPHRLRPRRRPTRHHRRPLEGPAHAHRHPGVPDPARPRAPPVHRHP